MAQDYIILKGSSLDELRYAVQAKLNEGWTCQGGVSATVSFSPVQTGSGLGDAAMFRGVVTPGSGYLRGDIYYKNVEMFYQALVK